MEREKNPRKSKPFELKKKTNKKSNQKPQTPDAPKLQKENSQANHYFSVAYLCELLVVCIDIDMLLWWQSCSCCLCIRRMRNVCKYLALCHNTNVRIVRYIDQPLSVVRR